MGNSKWSLLHDIGYAYFVLGLMGQSQEKARQVRLSKIKEIFSEWPSEGNNHEKILKEVMQTAGKDMENSMDPVLKRLQSSLSNIKQNLSEDNLIAIINDLLSIVNASSPQEVEINQINHIAEQIGVKTLKKQEANGKSGQNKINDESWTLLHDMCYLYFMVASLPLLQGSNAKKVKLRIDAAVEKILEWPCDDIDSAQLVQRVIGLVMKDLQSGDLKVEDKIYELATKIKEYMPEENHSSVLEDLTYIMKTWTPNKTDDEKTLGYIAHLMEIDDESSEEETEETSSKEDDGDINLVAEDIAPLTADKASPLVETTITGMDLSQYDDISDALIDAALFGFKSQISELLTKGANVNHKNAEGTTALHHAATGGHTDTAKLLIDKGADMEAKDNRGWNALVNAAGAGKTKTAALLVGKGANIESTTNRGATPLIVAAANGQVEAIGILLDAGANINTKNIEGQTALMRASFNGHTEAVELLIDKGADIEAQDNEGKTALSVAKEKDHQEIVNLLKKSTGEKKAKSSSDREKAANQKEDKREQKTAKKDNERGQKQASDDSEFLSNNTVPAYPGPFYFLPEKYSTKLLRMKNFYRLSKTDELFRKFTKDEVACLVKKIKSTKTIPKLMFVREILEEKYAILVKDAPFWFIPFVILAEEIGCFIYFDRNGLYANYKKATEIEPAFGWESATDVICESGFPELDDDSNSGISFQFSVEADPDAKYPDPDETVSTLVLKADGGHLTINEFHGDEYGSQLLIMKTIWELWRIVVDYSAGSNIWPQNDKVPNGPEYKYFDSWDALLAWAGMGVVNKREEKTIAAKKSTEDSRNEKTRTDIKKEEPYRQKVREAIADGIITDLEQTGLDFFQRKLKLSDEDSIRIFEEVLAEMQGKAGEQAVKTRTERTERAAEEESMSEETDEADDGGGKSSKKRVTYQDWEDFSREQSEKDERKKANLPIAKKIHDLIVDELKAKNTKFEIRYGDGTFSFSMPKDEAKSGKRTFARVGLLSLADKCVYLDTLYRVTGTAIPPGSFTWKKNDDSQFLFRMKTIEDFEKVRNSITQSVIGSYNCLAKTKIR